MPGLEREAAEDVHRRWRRSARGCLLPQQVDDHGGLDLVGDLAETDLVDFVHRILLQIDLSDGLRAGREIRPGIGLAWIGCVDRASARDHQAGDVAADRRR